MMGGRPRRKSDAAEGQRGRGRSFVRGPGMFGDGGAGGAPYLDRTCTTSHRSLFPFRRRRVQHLATLPVFVQDESGLAGWLAG